MAKSAGLSQAFYIGGADLSGDITTIDNCSSVRQQLEVTGLNQTAIHRLLTYQDGDISFTSYFNDAAGQAHTILKTLPTTDVGVLWQLGSTAGNSAAFMVAKQVNYDPTRGSDGSFTASVQTLNQGSPMEWGNMLTAGKITHSSASSAASVDGGAATANGLSAMIQLVSLDSGTVTMTIQDSANDSSWGTLIAFSSIAAAAVRTSERVTISGEVLRYLRVTTTGTFSNAVFSIAFRRGTAQDDVSL
jgi:hypothetical protein